MKRPGQPKRKRPLRPKSVKRAAERTAADPVVAAVLYRDQGCVAYRAPHAGDCRGKLTPHHLLKAGQGGLWTLDNLVALCAGHNGWVEDHPDQAHALGLVIRRGENDATAWRSMRHAELIVGTYVPACPGSLRPPRAAYDGDKWGTCSCCRYSEGLVAAPDGGPGPVFPAHDWHAPTLGDPLGAR